MSRCISCNDLVETFSSRGERAAPGAGVFAPCPCRGLHRRSSAPQTSVSRMREMLAVLRCSTAAAMPTFKLRSWSERVSPLPGRLLLCRHVALPQSPAAPALISKQFGACKNGARTAAGLGRTIMTDTQAQTQDTRHKTHTDRRHTCTLLTCRPPAALPRCCRAATHGSHPRETRILQNPA